MWQKCPICNGTGNNNTLVNEIFSNVCKTCSGKGIINELTGVPPKNRSHKDDRAPITDFTDIWKDRVNVYKNEE